MSRRSEVETAQAIGSRATGLPERRVARLGTEDLGTAAWAARGRELNMRRSLDFLLGNPAARGRQRWRLRDSLGRPLVVIEKHSNRWDVHDVETNETLYSDYTLKPDQLEVQGVGCMATDELERRHALVAFRATDRRGLEDGESIVPFQLRAFIDRNALPRRNRSGQSIGPALADFDTGCGSSGLRAVRRAPIDEPRLPLPGGPLRGRRRHRSAPMPPTTRRPPTAGPSTSTACTTGVHGGGIVRGVARVGDLFEELDSFDYCDQNVDDGKPLARWVYGRVAGTRLHGWMPTRC